MRITLDTFRKLDRLEEKMIRSMMPKLSAADPEPLVARNTKSTATRTFTLPLTFKMMEVAHA